jgi:stage III sporulation protein AA
MEEKIQQKTQHFNSKLWNIEKEDTLNRLDKLLPVSLYKKVKETAELKKITQIRLRIHQPLIINLFDKEIVCMDFVISSEVIQETFNKITGYSAYAFEESIKSGYITVAGGHRVGFGGETVFKEEKIVTIKNIRFLNIRVSHSISGCGEQIAKLLIENNKVANTLIISPPGLGKTTLLRDLIRIFSNKINGTSICVIDERNEISGSYMGVPNNELGIRTDVISNCTKDYGIKMAIRSMAPEIIAVDEIGGAKDIESLMYASRCGVRVIATIHGETVEDVKKKLGQAGDKIFSKKILISGKGEYICY